jgi:hypothetical protein
MKKFSLSSRFTIMALIGSLMVISPSLLADNGPEHRARNLNFGVSGGNVNDITRRFCCSGTLGALLTDGTNQYILSNNHVMGLSGRAVAGQDISQPGLIDNNCQVSTVVADFTMAPPLSSGVDAAIAQLRPGTMNANGSIEDIGVICGTPLAPTVGLAVQKSGRTTGFTTGSISSINTTVSVRYPKSCGGGGGTLHTFANQVVITSSTFSAGGDSGSLIVSNNGGNPRPVALLFAGSSSSTIGNPISRVLQEINSRIGPDVSFVGTCSASLDSPVSDGQVMPEQLESATKAKESKETDLMGRPGVIGVGVGTENNEAVIIVYVNANAPTQGRLPKKINGVKVKRVFTEEFVAY